MTLGVTGHRLGTMGLSYSEADSFRLACFASDVLQDLKPDHVVTGMALGWDQAVAKACVAGDIPFTAAVPFKGQEKLWPESSRAQYKTLLGLASEVVIVSDVQPQDKFTAVRLLDKRNHWIVDHSGWLLALWNGKPSGTGNCVSYAEDCGLPVIHVWSRWKNFKG